MLTIENKILEGERAEFASEDTRYIGCTFQNGESPLKECRSLEVKNCNFAYKYPLWYGEDIKVEDCLFAETERAGVWYTKKASFSHLQIKGPKNFRKCESLSLSDCEFADAQETLWWNKDVLLENVKATNAAYFGMGSQNLTAKNLDLDGNYAFDGSSNLILENCTLHTKDAFWNCKKVTLKNCRIVGEYFGWNSEDITLIDCHVESHQGFCYMKNLTLINTEVVNSDLCFEYCSNINAEVVSEIDSVKNPISGKIKAKGIKRLILDESKIDPSKTEIILG